MVNGLCLCCLPETAGYVSLIKEIINHDISKENPLWTVFSVKTQDGVVAIR